MSPPKKSILITGCSPNKLASALVPAFLHANFHVFACVRGSDPSLTTHLPLPKDQILPLDLTSASSISSLVEKMNVLTSGRGIDILFNAARVEFVMPILDTDAEEGKRCFDINVWGTLAMTKAFMPMLTEREGMIVNLSSIGALVNVPWLGVYAASEAALNNMSETLRLELAPFNVKVLTVITGPVKADIFTKPGEFELPPGSIYAPIADKIDKFADGTRNPEMMPANVYAEQVVADVLRERSGLVYRGNFVTLLRGMSWLPAFILDRLIGARRGLEELAEYVKSHGPSDLGQ